MGKFGEMERQSAQGKASCRESFFFSKQCRKCDQVSYGSNSSVHPVCIYPCDLQEKFKFFRVKYCNMQKTRITFSEMVGGMQVSRYILQNFPGLSVFSFSLFTF